MNFGQQRHFRGAAVAVLVAAGTVLAAVPGPAEAAGPSVCAGISKCRVVAHVDVDGNGTRDAVGLARLGKNGGPNSSLVVRVKLGAHRTVKARRKLPYWSGPVFQGAAFLDGRKGRELVVGHSAGAHSLFFRALTWRNGRLVDLRAPGGGLDWYVDGAWSINAGFLHPAGTSPGTLLRRVADRWVDDDEEFEGTVDRYIWSAGRFKRVERRTYAYVSEETAYRWGGFLVPGLARF
jgi:hypothetical protein